MTLLPFNNAVDLLPELMERSLQKPCFDLDHGTWFEEYCGIYYSPYYSFLAYAARLWSLSICLELGVEKGRGAAALAMGMQSAPRNTEKPLGRVIGLDTVRRTELEELEQRFPHFTFLQGPSSTGWAGLGETAGRKIGVLHVDTEHSYSMAQMEFELYEPYLEDGAFVCFDDTHAAEDSVLKYVRTLDGSKGKVFERDDLHPVCGYAVLVYRRDHG